MTVGALLFAFDSDIKYTKLAIECAKRIQKFLNIPTSLVTDVAPDTEVFDKIIIVDKPVTKNKRYWHDSDMTTTWYNAGRSSAFDYSPYERTLLIDIDYMVNSNNITQLLNSPSAFLCHQTAQDVIKPKAQIIKFGTKNTLMWWATVIVFDKSNFSRDVFSCWQMIEKHYEHYAQLFGFAAGRFRNDYALSLALLLANGNSIPEQCNIPWPLMNVNADSQVKCENNIWWIGYKVQEQNKTFYKNITVKNNDLHIMGKSYLEKIYEL